MVQDQEESSISAPGDSAQGINVGMAMANLARAINSGGSWFYWIAGLSIVNTLIAMFNGKIVFVVGLGATQIVNEFIRHYHGTATVIGLPINIAIAGIYALFGYCACQRMKWAFVVGMVLYSFDALIFLLVKDWLAVGFHAFAMYGIYRGVKALSLYRRLEAHLASQPPA